MDESNQVIGLIFVGIAALGLGLFLPKEKNVLAALLGVGLILILAGVGLSSLRGIPANDLFTLRDRTQFGKMIPIGYALLIGSVIAWLRQMLFSKK